MVQSQKILPPRSAWVVARERLTSRLTETRDKRVALVVGQAAQGKSTLAAEYVETTAEPFAWINLDSEDADPTNLYLWLVRAVQTAWPGLDVSQVMSLPSATLGPRAPAPMFREWAAAMLTAIPGPMELVLDGLDRLNGGPSFELLQVLVEETPPGIRWLMLSRARPPLETERWEINRLAVTIPNEDLAFTENEISMLGNGIYQYDFTPDQIRAMFDFTEGWVGGLMVVLESLRQYENPQDGLNLIIRGMNGLKGRIFQYLAEQVFNRLPQHIQEFLTVTSILENMDAQVAEALTGQGQAASILQDMVDRNFFVSGHYGSEPGRRYRYHQLFREFLQARFETAYRPDERSGWKRQAAGLYLDRGEPEAALRLYLSAEAWDEAAGILSDLGRLLLKSGRVNDLARWIGALPENRIQDDPWLTTYLSSTRRYTAAGKNLPDLARAAARFREQGDIQGRLTALAFLVEAQNAIGVYVQETVRECLDILGSLETDDYPFERGHLWHQIGFYETLHGDYPLAHNACRNAILIARRIENEALLVNALANSVTIVAFFGKFKELHEIRREMDNLLARTDNREVHGLYQVADSLATVFTGHPGQAVTKIQKCLRHIESYGLYYLMAPATLYKLICLGYNEQIEEATAAAAEAIQYAKNIGHLFLETVSRLFWGMSLYRRGQYNEAEHYLGEALDVMHNGHIQAPYHEAAGTLVLHLSRMARGEPPIISEIERAHDRFLKSGSPLLTADSTLIMALAYRTAGCHEKADEHFSKGFSLTAQYGYDFFIFISPTDLVRAGTEALVAGLTDALPEVIRLLGGRWANLAPRHLRPLLKHKRAAVRDRARDLLLKIRQQSLPSIRIQSLGGLMVYRNEIPLTEEDWGGAMPKDLLKAIISLGPRQANRDVVMDALWPEATPKAAANNLKIALHRLRHALEPDLDSALGSAYVLLKGNTITLTDAVAEIDLERFEGLARTARSMNRNTPIKAIAACNEAIDMHGGPFLAEDLYADWIIKRRNHFQNLFQEMVMEKAGRHENLGHFKKAADCYRQVLTMDPTHEETARRLMNLLAAHGRRNEALKVFDRLQGSLEQLLGVEPEEMTQLIYHKILQS